MKKVDKPLNHRKNLKNPNPISNLDEFLLKKHDFLSKMKI